MQVDELRAGSGWLRKVLRPPFASALRVVCTENLIRVDDVMESPKLAE
jgi:hypothetical protein